MISEYTSLTKELGKVVLFTIERTESGIILTVNKEMFSLAVKTCGDIPFFESPMVKVMFSMIKEQLIHILMVK